MAVNYATLSNFNYQDEQFQATLMAELVDALNILGSGILSVASETLIPRDVSGHFVDIPQYETVSGLADQIVSGSDSNIYDFADYKMRAVWVLREKAFGVEDLVQIMAAKDPIGELIRQVSNFWARNFQATAISVIQGCMATALALTHSTGNTYTGNKISYDGILAAKQLVGDKQFELNKAIAHSKVMNDAVLQNIAQFPNSILGNTSAQEGNVSRLAGMNTWMEDQIVSVGDVYSTYFAAPGQLVYQLANWKRKDINGNAVVSQGVDIEFFRKPEHSGGTNLLFTRCKYLVHLNGMQYNSADLSNPTDAQLATGVNWTKVADDDRKIKIVELKTA